MAEEKNFILYKPKMACLMTHASKWIEHGVGVVTQRMIYECTWCKDKFFYPTKKDDYPVY